MTEQPYSKRHLMLGLAAVPFSFFMPIAHSQDNEFVFTPQSTIGDVLDEPLFAPFASYLLPLELLSPTRRLSSENRAMKLSNLSRLLPYHTHIDVQEACSILNRLKQRAKSRQKIWIPLSSSDAGLFFTLVAKMLRSYLSPPAAVFRMSVQFTRASRMPKQ